jgi:hypothetical protein
MDLACTRQVPQALAQSAPCYGRSPTAPGAATARPGLQEPSAQRGPGAFDVMPVYRVR